MAHHVCSPQHSHSAPPSRRGENALCVDLDGTLVKSDLLVEAVLLLLRSHPLLLFYFPSWLVKGRAYFKQQIALHAIVDPACLPYDLRILELIKVARENGREVVLVTASARAQAEVIAAHLGVFDRVIATDNGINLSGARKADHLVADFGDRGFDYAGNHAVDIKVWAHARQAWVVNASSRLPGRAAAVTQVGGVLARTSNQIMSWIRAARLHQWLKNMLVFVPLIAAHEFSSTRASLAALLAFFAFGLTASSVYITNDLLDIQHDRQHPRKKTRPFASGDLAILQGAVGSALLLGGGLALAATVSPNFLFVLTAYWLATSSYSLWLKQVEVLDVSTLAGLYTIRVVAGAVAAEVPLSFWMLAFSMFLFFSLAVLKRLIELRTLESSGRESIPGRGYSVRDLPLLQGLGSASGLLAVLVLAMYVNSPESIEQYRRAWMLWFLCPLLLYWVSRIWLMANRGSVHDDPLVYAATDRVSLILAVLGTLIVAVAT